MNTPIACLSSLLVAAITAFAPADPPREAVSAAEPEASAPADSLSVWRERAVRAEAWLKARGSDAKQAAADALARARREVLGTEQPVAQATLAIATRPADLADPVATGPAKWVTIDDTFLIVEPAAITEVVLLVHGLDEPGTIWDELTPHLLDHGATVVRFDYPNDQGLVESSRDLLAALRRLRVMGIERISIVAHSMGGLVSREVLTCRDGYAGNAAAAKDLPAIERLIMCGTPNHGSPLASMQAVAEAREQVVRRVQGTAAQGSGLLSHAADGNGEAGRDLCEGSEFLTALNARPQPLGVAMTTLCGIVTPAAACEYLKVEASEQWAGFLGSDRAKALTLQACAIVETLGDGMVPAASTRLEGVADHVELKADHRSMLKRWAILKKLDELRGRPTPPAEAIPIILDRLGLEPLPTAEPVDPMPRAE